MATAPVARAPAPSRPSRMLRFLELDAANELALSMEATREYCDISYA